MNRNRNLFAVLVLIAIVPLPAQKTQIDQWTYIQIDSTRQNIGSLNKTWLRAFGLAFGDVNGDGDGTAGNRLGSVSFYACLAQ